MSGLIFDTDDGIATRKHSQAALFIASLKEIPLIDLYDLTPTR